MFKKISCILLSLIIVIVMSGCGSLKDLTSGKNEEEQFEESKNINLSMSDIKTLNPVISQDEDTYYISKLIYQSLFTLDNSLTPQKDLASEYEISKTGKSVIVKLDGDAKFSDGEKVTSGDVKFSINAIKEAGKKSKYYYEVKDITKVETDGSSKVKIVFSDYGGSLAKLTFPILPSHKESIGELNDKSSSFKPLGSGAYYISKYTKNEKLVLKPNKYYSGEKAENILNFTTYEKKSKVMNLLEGNIVSFVVSKSLDRQTEIGGNNLRNGDFPSNKLEFIGFNCNKKYFESDKVRQAFCYGIDISSILQKAFYGSGIQTDSVFYPGYLGMEDGTDAYVYDKKTAKKLLEDAGWKDRNKDGYIEPKGKKGTFKVLVADNAARKKTASFIVSDLEEMGVSCEVKKCSDKAYKKALKNGKFDIYVGEISFGEAYDMTDFLGGSLDFTGYDSSKLEKKVKKTAKFMEPEDMLKNAMEIKETLNEKVPVYPIIYKTYSYVISDELEGDVNPIFNDIYIGCEKWKSKYEIKETYEEKEKKK